MFPLRPEGEDGPEPEIIGTEGRARLHWRWYVVAVGVLVLAGVIKVASLSSSERHAALPHPSGVTGSVVQLEPPAPKVTPSAG